MTKEEVKDLYDKQYVTIIKDHNPLVVMCCVPYNDFGIEDTEFIFTVPINWLVSYMDKISGRREWDWDKVHNWLMNEYTSEDSELIFQQACIENVCVNLNFNE